MLVPIRLPPVQHRQTSVQKTIKKDVEQVIDVGSIFERFQKVLGIKFGAKTVPKTAPEAPKDDQRAEMLKKAPRSSENLPQNRLNMWGQKRYTKT